MHETSICSILLIWCYAFGVILWERKSHCVFIPMFPTVTEAYRLFLKIPRKLSTIIEKYRDNKSAISELKWRNDPRLARSVEQSKKIPPHKIFRTALTLSFPSNDFSRFICFFVTNFKQVMRSSQKKTHSIFG